MAGELAVLHRPEEKSGRTLVVDDAPAVRRLLRAVLKKGGYQVAEAGSASEALSQMLDPESRPDLVFLDLLLWSDEDGLGLLSRMRQFPVIAHIPVVVVTGNITTAQRERALQAGAVAFVPKPFSPAGLLELTARILRGERIPRGLSLEAGPYARQIRSA